MNREGHVQMRLVRTQLFDLVLILVGSRTPATNSGAKQHFSEQSNSLLQKVLRTFHTRKPLSPRPSSHSLGPT